MNQLRSATQDTAGTWNFYRYDSCASILRNVSQMSSDLGGNRTLVGGSRVEHLLRLEPVILGSSDPPQHTRVRSPLATLFRPTPPVTAKIRMTVARKIDLALRSGSIDVVNDLGRHIISAAISALLAIPEHDLDAVERWCAAVTELGQHVGPSAIEARDDLLPPATRMARDEAIAQAETATREADGYFAEMLARRRRNPGPDAASRLALLSTGRTGPLTDREARSLCFNIAFAGYEPFGRFMGGAAALLARRSFASAHVPTLIEELLRYHAPVGVLFRRAASDVRLECASVKKNDHVRVWISAANFDGKAFPYAERFDHNRREKKQHLSFGFGPHYCLGAALTRAAAKETLHALLTRLVNFESPQGNTEWPDSSIKGPHEFRLSRRN